MYEAGKRMPIRITTGEPIDEAPSKRALIVLARIKEAEHGACAAEVAADIGWPVQTVRGLFAELYSCDRVYRAGARREGEREGGMVYKYKKGASA